MNHLSSYLKSHRIVGKRINVSLYPTLANEIPDDTLVIESVFKDEELDKINEYCAPYLSEFGVTAFSETLGDMLVCVGVENEKKGFIYYFDMDFGCFKLDDSIEKFVSKLI
ncbi:SMI1/KNR4 family protein [Pseudoalteromonas sp. SWXJZ94C]|uniref:SMI1/KNR4 family protein n=1 Tax=Pseudoalteromonas sp. SWXJZ94C TaxID=2792065 RepID=UPI0018CDF2C4|nr:SMI1/KNR4 family protein [Pseudoalteromonas sp. SWXJZ94C]MBH0059155.1 SMI1/KNR4 family protein [Pseudoalteromonas sp. SWXJZ94C]